MSVNKALLIDIMNDLDKPTKFKRPHNQWQDPGEITKVNSKRITMKGVTYPVVGVDANNVRIEMIPEGNYEFTKAPVIEYPMMSLKQGGQMIKRADGSYSRRGLWDNIRANKGSGKKPTKEMLEQERKIRAEEKQFGGTLISDKMYSYENPYLMKDGGEPDGAMAIGQIDAAIDRLMMLRKFIKPDTDLEPWVSSKLTLMDHYTDAVSNYMQYNPEAQEEGLMEMAQGGGIPQRYKNMGFSKTGVKKKSNRPGKKWMVLAKKGDQYKVVHGGYKGMQDYTQHGSSQRRKNFWNRMGGKNSAKAKDPFSPLYWHKRFGTWQDGGEINGELPEVERFKRIKTPPVPVPYSNEYVGDITNRYNDFYAKMYNAPIPFAPPTQRDDGFDAFVYDAPHETPPSRLVVKMLADKFNKQQQNMSRWDTYKGGGYIGYDGKRHASKTPTWSGVMGYQAGGEANEDSTLENIAEIIDPTGISSYDDVIRSYRKSGMSPETFIEAFGALPLIGKFGKLTKAGIHLSKYKGMDKYLFNRLPKNKNLSNGLLSASIFGRMTDAFQAGQNMLDAPILPGSKKKDGGYIKGDLLDVTPEQAEMLKAAGYEFEIIEP